MKYPRVCAHRGFSAVLPENTLAAFGAAVGMGAHEFEFDLWPTCDRDENGNWCGEIVSVHDSFLERLSDGAGYIWEKTWDELQTYDFGMKHGEEFRGTRILTFEQILQKFSCHAVMAIHLKTRNYTDPLPEAYLQKIITLIRRYDCAGHCYFLTGNKTLLCQLRTLAPDIARCCDVTDDPFGDTVAAALETGCERISFYRPYFEKTGMDRVQDTINRAHENGLRCNMFYADTAEETEMFLAMGADVIVTNHLQKVLPAVEKYRKSSG